jgi:hypothetical protein
MKKLRNSTLVMTGPPDRDYLPGGSYRLVFSQGNAVFAEPKR